VCGNGLVTFGSAPSDSSFVESIPRDTGPPFIAVLSSSEGLDRNSRPDIYWRSSDRGRIISIKSCFS